MTLNPQSAISVANNYAVNGNLTALSKWLSEGNNPNAYDDEGWTPLLKAAVRGQSEAVRLLIEHKRLPADVRMPHRKSGALALHFAGHSGSVATVRSLLNHQPSQLNAIWDLNGHTVLLQAAFYGHLELAKFLVEQGADTSITTARGLGPMEMARQFQNQDLMDIIRPYDVSAEKKSEYYHKYLQRIAPVVPKEETEIQKLSDDLVNMIEHGLLSAVTNPKSAPETFKKIENLLQNQELQINRLGGPLQQPPLVVTVTGHNGLPHVEEAAELRIKIAGRLLEKGADPSLHEVHPMGAQTIIRACVFNHLDILKMCAQFMTKEKLADNLNEIPVVNGLTALHDTVLRATMASPEYFEMYLAQTRWCIENCARSDIEDFSGRTQINIAENAADKEKSKRLLEVLKQ